MSTHFAFVDIVLDGNKKRFQSGEDVTGVIRFSLKGSSIVENIKICLNCISEVKWETESSSTIYDRGGHIYYNKSRLLNLGYPLPKKYEMLSDGEHEVPFSFKLPEKNIPSSFVGPHGTIKYYIEVITTESGVEEENRVGLLEFDVDSPQREGLKLSIGCSKEKELGRINLADGKINLYASLSRKGWAPGELLELHVTVHNESTDEVTPRATLHQTQVYMCGERHKGIEITLSQPIVGKTVHKKTNFSETFLIPLPEDLSLSIKSGIISVKYFIHVTLDIPHAFDLHVNLPIVVVNKSALTE